jgi:hypothetical protein
MVATPLIVRCLLQLRYDPRRLRIGLRSRVETTMTLPWIEGRLMRNVEDGVNERANGCNKQKAYQ